MKEEIYHIKYIEGTPIKRVHFSKKKSIPAISRIVNL